MKGHQFAKRKEYFTVSDSPTPNDMPGAPTSEASQQIEPKPEPKPEAPKAAEPEPAAVLSDADAAELAKLRKIHADESKWEKRAKHNFDDAQKFRALLEAAGVEKPADFDPKAEYERLRSEIESERTERVRAEVARATNVDPQFILGSTEEDMRASAQRYQDAVNQAVQEALKAKNIPAAPASTVTANGKISGPEQITTRDQLKTMSPQDIVAARNEGRLDQLLGKST